MTTTTKPWWREPTRAQLCAFGAAWAGWVLDAFDFTIFFFVIPAMAAEFEVSETAVTVGVMLPLLARLLGGAAAGWAADRWGRKPLLLLSVLWLAAFDSAVALAPSLGAVLVLRLLFGIGMGAEYTAGTTLAMESWPERSRGIASGVLQGSWAIGFILAALASAFVLPVWGWRAMFILAAAPALLVLPIRIWVKESPEWRRPRAAALRAGSDWRALLEPGVRSRLVWSAAALSLGFGVYYAMTGMYPTMLRLETGLEAGGVGVALLVFNAGFLIGAVAAGVIAARRGIIAAVAIPSLVMVPLLPLYVGLWPDAILLGAFLGGAVGVGWAGIVPLYLTSSFPPAVRARAVGLAYHVGACFAASVTTLVSALHEEAGLSRGASIVIVTATFEIALAALLILRPAARLAPAPRGA